MAPNDRSDLHNHPCYSLRRFIIVSGTFGILLSLCIIGMNDRGSISSQFVVVLFWLFVSVILSVWDLIDWKLKHATSLARRPETPAERQMLLPSTAEDVSNTDGDDDGGNDNKPRKIILVLDIVLLLILAYVWLCTVAQIEAEYGWGNRYGYNSAVIIMVCSYGTVSLLLGCFCHAVCFWKQLMAIKRNGWEKAFGLRKREFQEQLNRFMDSAALFVSDRDRVENAQASSSCRCGCAAYAEDVAHLIRQEKVLVERLMKGIGKLSSPLQATKGYEEVDDAAVITPAIYCDATGKKTNHNLGTDVEAGLSYQHQALESLDQPFSTTYKEVDTPNNTSNTASKSSLTDPLPLDRYEYQKEYWPQHSVTGETKVFDSIEPVLEAAKGSSSRKRKGKETDHA